MTIKMERRIQKGVNVLVNKGVIRAIYDRRSKLRTFGNTGGESKRHPDRRKENQGQSNEKHVKGEQGLQCQTMM
jgi:hypothetical protein